MSMSIGEDGLVRKYGRTLDQEVLDVRSRSLSRMASLVEEIKADEARVELLFNLYEILHPLSAAPGSTVFITARTNHLTVRCNDTDLPAIRKALGAPIAVAWKDVEDADRGLVKVTLRCEKYPQGLYVEYIKQLDLDLDGETRKCRIETTYTKQSSLVCDI